MKKLIVVLVVGAALGVGWYVVSPWLAMEGLRDAAMETDREELEERVDFAAIRDSMKDEVRDAVEREVDASDHLLEQLGGAIATGIGGLAVDAAVTPTGVAALVLTGQFAAPFVPEDVRGREIDWSVDRGGLDTFEAHGRFENGRAGPTLRFERDGLGWDLVDIDLPDGGS